MRGTRAQQLGLGWSGACLLAALLCFSFLPLYAQDYTPPQRAPLTVGVWPIPKGPQAQQNVCGKTNFQGKIYGGQMASSERWPWQASLLFRGSHICGAVLIDKNWVASTAHCFLRSRKPSDYRILLGYNQLGSPTNSSRQMTVNKLILHENYNKFHHQGNDIALIQLHKPVAYSSSIFPACVPENTTKVFQARSCWISGWGMLEEDKFLPAPFPLQEAEVSLIDDKECETFFHTSESISQYNIIKDDMICAGDVKNEKSICLGDTGGPLVCSLNGSWYVVGLASWSAACLEPISSPNIFTKISYFSNWIKKKKEETPDADPFSAPADENAPTLVGWRSFNTGTILKPSICRALLSSHVLLLQSIWFQIP